MKYHIAYISPDDGHIYTKTVTTEELISLLQDGAEIEALKPVRRTNERRYGYTQARPQV